MISMPCATIRANVPAGFPSPADDHIEGKLDLNEHLVRRPHAANWYRKATKMQKKLWRICSQSGALSSWEKQKAKLSRAEVKSAKLKQSVLRRHEPT